MIARLNVAARWAYRKLGLNCCYQADALVQKCNRWKRALAILQQLRYLAQCRDYQTHIQKRLSCLTKPGLRVKDRFL